MLLKLTIYNIKGEHSGLEVHVFASLPKGTILKGKNLLPKEANSFLEEQPHFEMGSVYQKQMLLLEWTFGRRDKVFQLE